jgi:hypothetical protein
MPIWKLTPLHLHDPAWQASLYQQEVLVRAPTEAHARALAAAGMRRLVDVRRVQHTNGALPWQQARLVQCCRASQAPYAETGPDAVLWPAYAAGGDGERAVDPAATPGVGRV